MIEVQLSWSEMLIAGHGGLLRQVAALRNQLHDPDAHHRDPVESHVAGAIAEWAVSKAFEVRWDPTVGIGWAGAVAGDVGELEVRSTPLEHGSLIAHDYSFDDRVYLLVLAHRSPTFVLRGWMNGRDCKQKRWWRDNVPRPAYFVPQSALRPVEELLPQAVAA